MVVGFNHNFRYDGEIYHIQTEDSGLKSPNIVTLLYQGGTILASKKTSYADIAKVDNLEQVVEELMKEQHKNMLRDLKAGEFDAVISRFKAGKLSKPLSLAEQPAAIPSPAPVASAAAQPVPPASTPVPAPESAGPVVAANPVESEKPPEPPVRKQPKPPVVEIGLDEVILSYLMGDDK